MCCYSICVEYTPALISVFLAMCNRLQDNLSVLPDKQLQFLLEGCLQVDCEQRVTLAQVLGDMALWEEHEVLPKLLLLYEVSTRCCSLLTWSTG